MNALSCIVGLLVFNNFPTSDPVGRWTGSLDCQTESGSDFHFMLQGLIETLRHWMFHPAAARQSYKEQEALVYQQLAQLIRDAVWLKSYLAAVMRLETEAFQNAYAALGPAKVSMPVQLPDEMGAVPLPAGAEHGSSGLIPAARPYPVPPAVSVHMV